MHLSEFPSLQVQVRAEESGKENVADRKRTWQTLKYLGVPSGNKLSRYGHTPRFVKVC